MSEAQAPDGTLDVPLFPLNTVLFPGGVLPLQVFELRYLDMVGRCERQDTPFGVVCLTRGSEVRQVKEDAQRDKAGFETETFAHIGTLARIENLDKRQPGLWRLRCVGTQRFQVHHAQQQDNGLWTARVGLLPPEPTVPVALGDHLRAASQALRQLLNNLAQHQPEAMEQLPLREPHQWNDCAWVANRWLEVLPVTNDFKQQLLALDNPMLRLELVADQLGRMGIPT